MKRLSFILLLAFSTFFCANAQQVYTQIRQKASASVSDAAAAPVVRQFSRFKLDALDYLGMKMKEKMPDSTVVYLDKQALALNQFMSLYTQAYQALHRCVGIQPAFQRYRQGTGS